MSAQWTVCPVCTGPVVKSPALRNKVKEVIDSPNTAHRGVGPYKRHRGVSSDLRGASLGPKIISKAVGGALTEAAHGCHVWVIASIPCSLSTPKTPSLEYVKQLNGFLLLSA